MLEIEFDADKAMSNAAKHGVTFEYAIRAFHDPRRVVFDTSRSEDNERRLKTVGIIDGRVFTLVYTMRGKTIRIISARRANRKEERVYADGSLQI
jgi:uncharacterized DUF497 family protein